MNGSDNGPVEVALAFVTAINAADADSLAALMTEGFVFVDYCGNEFVGRTAMRDGFRRYFEQYPGYRIDVEQALVGGDSGALLIGRTRRSHLDPETESASTIAWLAEIEDGRVAVWRIFAPPAVASGD